MGPEAVRRRRGICRVLAVSSAALLVWSASEESRAQPRPPDGGDLRGVGPLSAEEIREALLAVEFWTDPVISRLPDFPQDLRPMSLERVGRILLADSERGAFGKSRYGRSMVTLVLTGLSFDRDGKHSHAHKTALDAMHAPMDQIDSIIEGIVNDFPRPPGVPFDPNELRVFVIERLRPVLVRQFVLAMLSSGCTSIGEPSTTVTMEWMEGMQRKSLSCGPGAPADAEVMATTQVLVKRKFSELAQLMDPQNWDAEESPPDECNVYFEDTYVVENQPNLGWRRVACPPTPGTEYQPAFLQEHFRMGFEEPFSGQSLDTSVITVLKITPDLIPDSGATECKTTYDFIEHIGSNIGNDVGGWIDRDSGFVRVSPDGTGNADHHMIQGEKHLRFVGWDASSNPSGKDAYYNMLACLALQSMGKALQEFVCCDVPTPPVCMPQPVQPGHPVLVP